MNLQVNFYFYFLSKIHRISKFKNKQCIMRLLNFTYTLYAYNTYILYIFYIEKKIY